MILVALLALPVAAGVVCALVPRRAVMEAVTVLAMLGVLITAFILTAQILPGGYVTVHGSWLYADALSTIVVLVVAVVGFTAALFSVGYMRHQSPEAVEGQRRLEGYYVLFCAFVFTMLLVPTVDNLGVMWIAIESTTLASALLVALYGTVESLEAAWKYIIIGSVGIALALFGTFLLSYAGSQVLGQGHYDLNWTTIIPLAAHLDPTIMRLVFLFILIGFGTKAGLAPMHTWLPDAHSEAPVPVSALLSGVLLNLALYGVFRYYAIAEKTLGHAYPSHLLMAFGLFSIVVAAIFIMRQSDYKRLLAYSSVEHMGIIAVGFAFGGTLATYGAFLQMLNHAITKSLMFFALGNVLLKYRTKHIDEVSGILGVSPVTAGVMLVGGLALVGSPPLNTFVSEIAIFLGGFSVGMGGVVWALVGLLVVVFIAFLRYINAMVFGPSPECTYAPGLNPWIAAAFALSLLPILGLGFYVPGQLNTILHRAIVVMSGG
jgi:hydrogenase-4 component F